VVKSEDKGENGESRLNFTKGVGGRPASAEKTHGRTIKKRRKKIIAI